MEQKLILTQLGKFQPSGGQVVNALSPRQPMRVVLGRVTESTPKWETVGIVESSKNEQLN